MAGPGEGRGVPEGERGADSPRRDPRRLAGVTLMFDYHQYFRQEVMPHIWCKGCGNGIVLKALLRAIHRLGLSKDRVALGSGAGCSPRVLGGLGGQTLPPP